MQVQLFDARMLHPLVQFLDGHGASSQPCLDRLCIPSELVQTGGWITKKQAYDFTFEVVNSMRSPDAVFSAYANFDVAHLGPIVDAMQACKTVKEALEVGARLGSTAFEGNEYFLEIDQDVAWFCYREPKVLSPGQTFINDMTLAVYYQIIRAAIGEPWQPERLRIRELPNSRHLTTEVFGDCRVAIDPNSTGLAFPKEFLSRRPQWDTPQTSPTPSHGWEFGPEEMAPLAERLYRLLASQFPYRKLPTLEQLALIVEISPRTLKRHLAAAGTSYSGLLDRLRFDAACELLTMPEFPIHDIAQELGYSGTNNFARSFRRMTGLSPGEYRRGLESS